MTTYAAGLRPIEVAALKPEHIDSQRLLTRRQTAQTLAFMEPSAS
jgi:hypothetical protein